jgi:DNA-binding GntR family transcriptional regulator
MVDRSTGLPAYRQVANDLRSKIDAGDYKPGDQLPTEQELIKTYGVSRPTVREAIGLLRTEDRVTVAHGKGAFVKLPKITTGPDRLTMLRATGSGFRPGERTEILEAQVTTAPGRVSYALGLPDGATAVQRQRIYYDDKGVIALSTSWLPGEFAEVAPELVTKEPLPKMTFGLVEERTGRRVVKRKDVVSIRPVPAEAAARLETEEGKPALTMTNTYWDQNGAVTEYAEDFLATDRDLSAEYDLT